jgi:hypothetical protein
MRLLTCFANGRHITDERKKMRLGNLNLDGSSHRTLDGLHSSLVEILTALESQDRLTKPAQHATHESKTKCTLLYVKGDSAQQ